MLEFDIDMGAVADEMDVVVLHDECGEMASVEYVPDRTTTAICVSNGVTGHCECELCGKSIDPWDGYCRHCGARITEVER